MSVCLVVMHCLLLLLLSSVAFSFLVPSLLFLVCHIAFRLSFRFLVDLPFRREREKGSLKEGQEKEVEGRRNDKEMGRDGRRIGKDPLPLLERQQHSSSASRLCEGVHLVSCSKAEGEEARVLIRFSGTGGLYQYVFGVCAALQDGVNLSLVDFDTTSGSGAGCFSLCLSLPVLATYVLWEERKRRHVRTHGPLIWASSEGYNLIYYHSLSLIALCSSSSPSPDSPLLSQRGRLPPYGVDRDHDLPLEKEDLFPPPPKVCEGGGEEEDDEEDERIAAEGTANRDRVWRGRDVEKDVLPSKGKHRILTCMREGKGIVLTDEYSSPHEYARAVATTSLLALEGGCDFLPGGECDAIWSPSFHFGEEGRDRISFPLLPTVDKGRRSEKRLFSPLLSLFTGLVREERVQYESGYADAMSELVPLLSKVVGTPPPSQPRSTDPIARP